MSKYGKKFKIDSAGAIKLKDFSSDFAPPLSKEEGERETQAFVDKMTKLQYLLYAEKKHSLLIVLQGLDGAGKDGTIRSLMTGMNPQGVSVAAFKQPTALERDHDFLWRVHPQAPKKGAVAIFNRSHYEDVLVVRVHDLVPKEQWSKRYDQINQFEKLLTTENNTTVLKFYLHMSKEEQLNRFKKRLETPAKQWKISESDYTEREYWDDYTQAYEELLSKTSTQHAPWFVVPSDHKWVRNLIIADIVTDAMESMDMKMPRPTVDIEEIRRKYHHAVREEHPKSS